MKTRNNGPQPTQQFVVSALSAAAQRGMVVCGGLRLPCALGRSGRRVGKREGDGATPIGRFALREVFYRADRAARPRTRLPVIALKACDGWCDDPCDRNYNRRVRHPYPASAERLWRGDHLYDLIVVLGYNDGPRIKGRGSAIFMHVATPGLKPTQGCIALERRHLMQLVARASPATQIAILP